MKLPFRRKKATSSTGGKGVAVLIFFMLLLVAAMAWVFGKVAEQEVHDQEFQRLLAEQEQSVLHLTKEVSQATKGKDDTYVQLRRYRKEFNDALRLISEGNPESGMPVLDTELLPTLEKLSKRWKKHDDSIQMILERSDVVAKVREIVYSINARSGQQLASADEVATLLVQKGAEPNLIYLATRQLMLSQRVVNNANKVLDGDEGVVTAADRFGRDAALFGRVVKGMLKGNRRLGITKVKYPEVRAKLEVINKLYDKVSEKVTGILELSPEMFQVSAAVQQVLGSSDALLVNIKDLRSDYNTAIEKRPLSTNLAYSLGILALILLIIMGFVLVRDSKNRVTETDVQRKKSEEQNRRNQQAIMRLLDEMGDLADGDLTVNVSVTEDVTGAIADSMNYAIDALRTLVVSINEIAGQVSAAAQQTQATAVHLAESSDHQAQQIASASTAVNEMAISIEGVSTNAEALATESKRSVEIAKRGTTVVSSTISSMDNIRDRIQETSKRIKRLGESSQEIGDIVELINDIAEQTNILSLNAAIQAAMAGDAGRGFAVVADEVQRLAERSAGATKQIEALVKTIQTDTNEAVISMEESTSGVVEGARQAEDAGAALTEIDRVALQLADLVGNISGATRQQAAAASSISDTMNVIQEITTQTSAGTNQTATSIGNLAQLAEDMKKSVAGFKLPD